MHPESHGRYWVCAACILVRNIIPLILIMLHQSIPWNLLGPHAHEPRENQVQNKTNPRCSQYRIILYTVSTTVPVYNLSTPW